jgi:hypothetical protein
VWCGFENHFWLQRVLKIGTLGFNDCMSGGGSGLGLGQGRCQCVCTNLLLIIQRSRKKGQIIDYKTLSRSNFAALCFFIFFIILLSLSFYLNFQSNFIMGVRKIQKKKNQIEKKN